MLQDEGRCDLADEQHQQCRHNPHHKIHDPRPRLLFRPEIPEIGRGGRLVAFAEYAVLVHGGAGGVSTEHGTQITSEPHEASRGVSGQGLNGRSCGAVSGRRQSHPGCRW